MIALIDRALALHGPLKPNADNGLTRPICRRCSTKAWKNDRYPCATRQMLERLRLELEKK